MRISRRRRSAGGRNLMGMPCISIVLPGLAWRARSRCRGPSRRRAGASRRPISRCARARCRRPCRRRARGARPGRSPATVFCSAFPAWRASCSAGGREIVFEPARRRRRRRHCDFSGRHGVRHPAAPARAGGAARQRGARERQGRAVLRRLGRGQIDARRGAGAARLSAGDRRFLRGHARRAGARRWCSPTGAISSCGRRPSKSSISPSAAARRCASRLEKFFVEPAAAFGEPLPLGAVYALREARPPHQPGIERPNVVDAALHPAAQRLPAAAGQPHGAEGGLFSRRHRDRQRGRHFSSHPRAQFRRACPRWSRSSSGTGSISA